MRRLVLLLLLLISLSSIILLRSRGGYAPCSCCYLTDVEPEDLMHRRFDVVILEMEDLTSSTVEALRGRCHLLLAYVNLGYAEDWRPYWSEVSGESWIHESTGYEGEHFIEFWHPGWRDVTLRLIDEAYRLGFEGVLLDNVDASTILLDLNFTWCRGVDTEELMIQLVENISRAVEERYGPDFQLYINIGSALRLLRDGRLLSSIDGVLREELWHIYRDGVSVEASREEVEEALRWLREARWSGKVVLVSDPIEDGGEAREFIARCREEGFKPIPQPIWAWDYSEPPPRSWCR